MKAAYECVELAIFGLSKILGSSGAPPFKKLVSRPTLKAIFCYLDIAYVCMEPHMNTSEVPPQMIRCGNIRAAFADEAASVKAMQLGNSAAAFA